jgi:hypothetical protein
VQRHGGLVTAATEAAAAAGGVERTGTGRDREAAGTGRDREAAAPEEVATAGGVERTGTGKDRERAGGDGLGDREAARFVHYIYRVGS